MNEYALSNNINNYLDYLFNSDLNEDTDMYATIYDQVKEATQGPYKDPQEILGNNTNSYR